MHFSKAAYGLALLTSLSLVVASAQAQTLSLGDYSQSGIGTLTDTGTTASGTYTYDDAGTGTPLVNQTEFESWGLSGSSTATVNGGFIGGLSLAGSSTANVSGGTFGLIEVYNTDATAVATTISGGDVADLSVFGLSTANVSGGSFNGFTTGNDTSVLDLFGTGLTETFVGAFAGPFFNYTEYTVTGTLLNGDLLNAKYDDYGGTLEFNGVAAVPSSPVPEASSFVSLGVLLLLGLGGVAVSRRRRANTAG